MDALLVAPAQLRRDRVAAQHRVDRLGDVGVDRDPLAVDWISTMTSNVGGALRSRTLFWVRRRRASSSPRVTLWIPPIRSDSVGLSIRLSRLLPCAVPMSWTPRSAIVRAACGLELGPDLVDDDDLGHVVLDRLDHHLVLERRRAHLHPAGLADGRVRDVAVAGDLVGGVDDDDALAQVVGQDAGGLAQHRRLADARAGP